MKHTNKIVYSNVYIMLYFIGYFVFKITEDNGLDICESLPLFMGHGRQQYFMKSTEISADQFVLPVFSRGKSQITVTELHPTLHQLLYINSFQHRL